MRSNIKKYYSGKWAMLFHTFFLSFLTLRKFKTRKDFDIARACICQCQGQIMIALLPDGCNMHV